MASRRDATSRRYYKGKVSRIHSDGTIDVKCASASENAAMAIDAFVRRYDDGDVDKNLKAKHVKALDAGSDSDGSAW